MPRRTHLESVQMLIRVLRLINDLAGSQTGDIGKPIPVREFADRLGMDVDDVIWCIHKINDGCGDSAPEMIVLYDADTQLVIPLRIESAFAHPLRLTAAEARGLIVAAQTAGYDTRSLIEKIEGAFPVLNYERIDNIYKNVRRSSIGSLVEMMTAASREHQTVEITYSGPNDETARTRVIEPLRVNYEDSSSMWYVVAWCRSSLGWRTFRLDRITHARLTGERFNALPPEQPEPETFSFAHARTAVLAVHEPSVIQQTREWHGLVRSASPSPFDMDRLTATEIANGAYIAHIPWIEGSSWLVHAVVQSLGSIEVIRPIRLREEVRDLARSLLLEIAVD